MYKKVSSSKFTQFCFIPKTKWISLLFCVTKEIYSIINTITMDRQFGIPILFYEILLATFNSNLQKNTYNWIEYLLIKIFQSLPRQYKLFLHERYHVCPYCYRYVHKKRHAPWNATWKSTRRNRLDLWNEWKIILVHRQAQRYTISSTGMREITSAVFVQRSSRGLSNRCSRGCYLIWWLATSSSSYFKIITKLWKHVFPWILWGIKKDLRSAKRLVYISLHDLW